MSIIFFAILLFYVGNSIYEVYSTQILIHQYYFGPYILILSHRNMRRRTGPIQLDPVRRQKSRAVGQLHHLLLGNGATFVFIQLPGVVAVF